MSATIKFYGAVGDELARPRQLICTVWALDGTEISDAVVQSQPICTNDSASMATSQLELPGAGTYLVELLHPGGHRSRRAVVVEDNQEFRFEIPRNVTSTKKRFNSGGYAKKSAGRVVMSATHSGAASTEVEILAFSTSLQLPTSLLNPRAFVASVLTHRRRGYFIARPTPTKNFSIDLPTGSSLEFEPPRGRSWLLARGGSERWTLIAYPNTWRKQDGFAPLHVSACQPSPLDHTAQWSISLGLLDPAHGTLLEFLMNDDWSSAWAVFVDMNRSSIHAETTSQENNFFTLAIAIYVHALTQDKEFVSPGVGRIRSVVQENPWMPDIGIAFGWWLLRQSEKYSDDFAQARQLVLQAVERGLPYFTIGLRILSDALNYLAVVDSADKEIKMALGAVTRANLACNQGEVFTTVDVSRYLEFSKKLGPQE